MEHIQIFLGEMMENTYLTAMKEAKDFETFYSNLTQYILQRYQLDEDTTEQNLLSLAKMSFFKQNPKSTLTTEELEKSVSKSDCRGTNSIVKKKILLIMNLEKKLNVTLDDKTSTEIDTTMDLAKALYSLCRRTL